MEKQEFLIEHVSTKYLISWRIWENECGDVVYLYVAMDGKNWVATHNVIAHSHWVLEVMSHQAPGKLLFWENDWKSLSVL